MRFTPQYEKIQELHARFHNQGFEILAFPCNDFGRQEPGSSDEIANFCKTRYGISFPLFEKINILGDPVHPFYKSLMSRNLPIIYPKGLKSSLLKIVKKFIYRLKGMQVPPKNGVQWNFQKFLIDRKGNPVANFASEIEPLDPLVVNAIEKELSR